MIDKQILNNPALIGTKISVSHDGKTWRTMTLHCIDQRRGVRVWTKTGNRGVLRAFKFAKCSVD